MKGKLLDKCINIFQKQFFIFLKSLKKCPKIEDELLLPN